MTTLGRSGGMSNQTDDTREPLIDDDRRDQAEDDALPPAPPAERPSEVDDLEMDDEFHRGDLADADPDQGG
jgi:hypothetical protein